MFEVLMVVFAVKMLIDIVVDFKIKRIIKDMNSTLKDLRHSMDSLEKEIEKVEDRCKEFSLMNS